MGFSIFNYFAIPFKIFKVMSEFIEILKYTIPSVVILLTAYFMFKRFIDWNTETYKQIINSLEKSSKNPVEDVKYKEKESVISLRLQAYERVLLYLERINPVNLVVREIEPKLTAAQYSKKLLNIVQNEFDHNITQQLYISNDVWTLVKNAKEEVLSLINTAAKNVEPDEPAVKLAEKILDINSTKETDPVENAILALKSEMKSVFL